MSHTQKTKIIKYYHISNSWTKETLPWPAETAEEFTVLWQYSPGKQLGCRPITNAVRQPVQVIMWMMHYDKVKESKTSLSLRTLPRGKTNLLRVLRHQDRAS